MSVGNNMTRGDRNTRGHLSCRDPFLRCPLITGFTVLYMSTGNNITRGDIDTPGLYTCLQVITSPGVTLTLRVCIHVYR